MVLILMLISLTGVMGAFRVANLGESILGNTSDYSRTVAAAEALLRDAETDIRGRLPVIGDPATTGVTSPFAMNADGALGVPCNTTVPAAGQRVIGCRLVEDPPGSGNSVWFPRSSEDLENVTRIATANDSTYRCKSGLCTPPTVTSLTGTQAIEKNISAMFGFGAYYGQYTGANPSTGDSNPSLSANRASATSLPSDGQPWGRYWVEVFRYAESVSSGAAAAANLVPDPSAPYIYRITAIARGRKPGSQVVIKSFYVPNPASQNR